MEINKYTIIRRVEILCVFGEPEKLYHKDGNLWVLIQINFKIPNIYVSQLFTTILASIIVGFHKMVS